jgi:predicted nucleic acid-binding protein
MTVYLDTNVLLDYILARVEYLSSARTLFALCETKAVRGSVSALSIANIVYIARKQAPSIAAETLVNKLSSLFTIIPLTAADIKTAPKLGFSDFEDALQYCAALRSKADCIVTRNPKDFTESKIEIVSPDETIARLAGVSGS